MPRRPPPAYWAAVSTQSSVSTLWTPVPAQAGRGCQYPYISSSVGRRNRARPLWITLRRFTADCVPFRAIVGVRAAHYPVLTAHEHRAGHAVNARAHLQTTPVLHTDGYAPRAANAQAHLQTASVLHTDGYAPRSRQCAAHLQKASVLHTDGYAPRSRRCAGTLADGIRFTYRWLCTEKPPMLSTHLQTASVLHTTGYAPRSRQCTAKRPACSAGTGMPLSPTTRAHGKCAYAMSRRMLNRPQLTPAGMSAQPQRKHNAHKVRPARVRRLRHPKREEAARCCQRAAPALSVMRACASVASLIRLLDRGLMGAVQPVAGMRAAVQEVYAMMA